MTQHEINLIRDARNALQTLSDVIDLAERGWCHGAIEDEEPVDVPFTEASPEEKQPSFEEVRGLLADKSRQGFREAVKDILTRHGVTKLSELPKEKFAAVMKEAEAING